MLRSRFPNGSTPTLELGAPQAPGGRAASQASVRPSHLGAHERGAELECETPRRERIPAPPWASDFGLTYGRGQVSLSPCCSEEKGHSWPDDPREGSQAAPPKGAAGVGEADERRAQDQKGKREGRVGGPRRRQRRTGRMRVCSRRGWGGGELGLQARGPSAAADPQARRRLPARLPPGPASPHCRPRRVLTTRLSRFPMVLD